MKLYSKYIESYSEEYNLIFNTRLTEEEWKDKKRALNYLHKYHISPDEYTQKWLPIQESIFFNISKEFPKVRFKGGYSLYIMTGGVLLEKEDFESLQRCMIQLGDKSLIIIQNDFGGALKEPPLRMKYPVNITWEELLEGGFISTALFENYHYDFFVFSESGNWGKYAANIYEYPLSIIGFRTKYETVFEKEYVGSLQENEKLMNVIPDEYKGDSIVVPKNRKW